MDMTLIRKSVVKMKTENACFATQGGNRTGRPGARVARPANDRWGYPGSAGESSGDRQK